MRRWTTVAAVAVVVSSLGLLAMAAKTQVTEKKKEKVKPNRVMHVVCFKFKEEAAQEQIDKVCKDFAELKNKIPGILKYQAGVNISPEGLNKGFKHCFILTFKNVKARDAYLPHPAHKEFGKSLGALISDVFVIDIETP
jgi:quinol monooxygenase YgiN